MVFYPDGAWYCQAKPEVIEQIIPEHLIGRMVVQEYAFLTHLLPQIPLVACEPLIKAEHPQDIVKQSASESAGCFEVRVILSQYVPHESER